MAELILHHYPSSPFAEKIRLLLGYKRLAWRSVDIPIAMPKPDLVALRRVDPRAGEAVVHFPRLGYRLTRAQDSPR